MRRPLTAAEIALLESHPHRVNMYLVVDRPPTLLSGLVNAPLATGITLLSYNNEETDPTTLFRTWEKLVVGDSILVTTTRDSSVAGYTLVGSVHITATGPAQLTVATNTIV